MSDELAVIEQRPIVAGNPLDLPSGMFKEALTRRGDNRKALMDWVRDALQEGRDFHVINGRKSMGKSGAEKICGMLGLKVVFPSLADYEKCALEGKPILDIILRCHVLDAQDRVVADGVGARNVEKDHGDLNKALKMAEKSAMIDAVLRCAGLSEVFTQDIEDMGAEAVKVEPVRPTEYVFGGGGGSGGGPGIKSPGGTAPDRKASPKQVKFMNDLIDKSGVPLKEFLEKYGVVSVDDMPFSSVNAAIDWLKTYEDVPQ